MRCPSLEVLPEGRCCWPLCDRDAVRDHQTTSPDGRTVHEHRRCTEHPRIIVSGHCLCTDGVTCNDGPLWCTPERGTA